MFRELTRLMLAVALLTLMGMSTAWGAMADTKHNLMAAVGNQSDGGLAAAVTNNGGLCRYCHAPHDTQTSAPLWDRGASVQNFDLYNSTTLDAEPTVAGVSMGCLSCHDGVTAFDAVGSVNATGTGGNNMQGAGIAGATNLGTDLSNDHPIGVNFTDTGLAATGDVTTAGLTLYGVSEDTVECGTCHDPHVDRTNFLRLADNTNLCNTCHNK